MNKTFEFSDEEIDFIRWSIRMTAVDLLEHTLTDTGIDKQEIRINIDLMKSVLGKIQGK